MKPPKIVVRKVTTGLIADVKNALRSLIHIPSSVQPPVFLDPNGDVDNAPPFPAAEILAFKNGLLHLPSYAAGKPCFIPPTPRFFSIAGGLNYDFNPEAPEPRAWLGFMRELWGDDQQSIDALQMWFGYTLACDTSQQKMLLLIGPPRSGKGTIARVLSALIGESNVVAPTLATLAGPFGLSALVGRSLAIVSDARLSGRTDSAVVTERLLSISGEDKQTVERKFRPAMTLKLAVRFLILTNELPRFADSSGALVSRMIVIETRKSYLHREDTGLTDKLCAERAGILLWAIQGWRKLRDAGRLLTPDSSRGLIDDFDDLCSPVGAFLRECCELKPEGSTPTKDLFARYMQWCTENERQAVNAQTFGRDLRAAAAIRTSQHRVGAGRARFFDGVALRAVTVP